MILIRADANSNIGMGHIMRCLSLADALRVLGRDVFFLLADNNVSGLVKKRGYKTIILNSSYMKMEDELDNWPSANPELIIVDSYYVTVNYLRTVKKKAHVVYIDDLAAFQYPVDALVNYNAYGPKMDYHGLYTTVREPEYFLGVSYTPLRKIFQNIPIRIQRKEVEDVLFSTGGSDEQHLIEELLKHRPEKYRYHILVGLMNSDKEDIRRLASDQKNVMLYENVEDMKSLICSCDIAVSAAGSTLYEICACGVPLITYTTADNQLRGAKAFDELGLAINIGDIRNNKNGIVQILKEVENLAENHQRRIDIGFRMQEMIDGKGAERLAKGLFLFVNK